MICIFDALCTDFSTNGLGPLSPTSLTIYEALNGRWEIKMEHPIDKWGKWTRLKQGRILRVPVPAGFTPRVEMMDISAGAEIWKVNTSGGRLRLRSGTSTNSRILGSYKKGTEVVVLDTANADWYEVTTPDGKRGFMYADYLAYVRTEPGSTAIEGIMESRPLRDQPFRIYRMVPTLEGFTVYARHLFYDLLDNMVVSFAPGKATIGASAFSALGAACKEEHEFGFYSDLTSTAEDFEISNTNPVDAILGENGAATKYGGELARDWYDIYLVDRIGSDRGVQIREGKNLTAIEYDEDITNVATRIMPTGTDADGNILYLPELYIDSENIDAYANPKWLHLPVDEAKESTSGDEKRSKEECYELMRAAAREKLAAGCDLPDVTMKIDFVNLADTEEYASFAILQTICMGDTVYVISSTLGKYVGIRLVESEYDGLKKKYTKMTLGSRAATIADSGISASQIASGSITGGKLAIDSVGSGQLQTGSVGSAQIGMAAINIAHISVAAIKQLNADAITAITGRFNEIAAGSITTDELYAAIAKIITLRVKQINAENITTDELYAALADVILLRAQQITADNIETDELAAAYAEITTLLVENINAGNVQADKLGAALANFVTMYASTGEFDFATIQNLVAKALSLEQASAESVYIKNLAVTSANLLSATLGKLVLKGDDGRHYRVFVGSDGSISTEEIVPTDDEIQNGQTSGGQQIVETSMNVGSLNASNLQASSAVINQILTTALTAEKITAADALIASASIPALYTTSIKALGAGLDLSANEYIQLIVGEVDSKIAAKSNVFRGETAPDDANVNDLWIVPSTGYTYQLAADDGSHPSYYLDENGVLYYSYGANQKEYALYMDDSGDLYISADTDFVAAITQDGTPALWQRVKDSELEDAAKAASDAAETAQIAAQAAQDKANQNAEDMAQTVTRFEGELSSLQSQIDGSITTWFEYGAPTYYNYPASQWTTADMRNAHLGDLYYDRYTGYCYRWQLSGSAYEWTRISDTDVTKALNDAAAAKDVADSKRRVFVSTPTPPYDIGDLWVQGANGDILRCQKPRAAGGYYYASDWVPASKYTDDTKANENAQIIAQHTAELQLMDSRITARVEQSISEVSGELETQISSSFSEVTQTVDELRVVMEQNRAADKSELRTYLRYADGTLELGRSGSRYVARTSDNGFVVLQDGAEMAAMVQNTVSAPVVEARRQFVLGEYAIRIGADGGILFV